MNFFFSFSLNYEYTYKTAREKERDREYITNYFKILRQYFLKRNQNQLNIQNLDKEALLTKQFNNLKTEIYFFKKFFSTFHNKKKKKNTILL